MSYESVWREWHWANFVLTENNTRFPVPYTGTDYISWLDNLWTKKCVHHFERNNNIYNAWLEVGACLVYATYLYEAQDLRQYSQWMLKELNDLRIRKIQMSGLLFFQRMRCEICINNKSVGNTALIAPTYKRTRVYSPVSTTCCSQSIKYTLVGLCCSPFLLCNFCRHSIWCAPHVMFR